MHPQNIKNTLSKLVDRFWVWLGGNHIIVPENIGKKPHDCALTSLYWAAPWIPESKISEAFTYCTENWPYAGITNKEFAIVLSYLNQETCYSDENCTLGTLLHRKPSRCVVLLHGHYIAIVKGNIVGPDAYLKLDVNATVYCHWNFHPRRIQRI